MDEPDGMSIATPSPGVRRNCSLQLSFDECEESDGEDTDTDTDEPAPHPPSPYKGNNRLEKVRRSFARSQSAISFGRRGLSASVGFGQTNAEADHFRLMRSVEMQTQEASDPMEGPDSPQRLVRRPLACDIGKSGSMFGVRESAPLRERTNSISIRQEVGRPRPAAFGCGDDPDLPPLSAAPPLPSVRPAVRLGYGSGRSASAVPAAKISRSHSMVPGGFAQMQARSQIGNLESCASELTQSNEETSRTSSRVMRKKQMRRGDSFAFPRKAALQVQRSQTTEEAEHERYTFIMKLYESPVPLLPVGEASHARAICSEQLAKLLTGAYDDHFSQVVVVDCRWPYEFKGGHIRGAISRYTKEAVMEEFLPSLPTYEQRTAIVFHCEFSQQRGPAQFKNLRDADRKHNLDRYPEMFYPFLFLLEGGYRKFYASYPELCDGGYREMVHDDFQDELRECNRLFRRRKSCSLLDAQGRRGLTRSCGYLQDHNSEESSSLEKHASEPKLSLAEAERLMKSMDGGRQRSFSSKGDAAGAGERRGMVGRARSCSRAEIGSPLADVQEHGRPAYRFAVPDVPVKPLSLESPTRTATGLGSTM